MSTVAELAVQIQHLSAADKHDLLRLLLTDSDEPEKDADEAWRESHPQWRGGAARIAGRLTPAGCVPRPSWRWA
jgi:hypothetical protein